MSRERARNRADAIADLRDDVVDVMATLGGDFDKRIKELQVLRKELSEREQAAKTLEQATEIKREADEYSSKIRKEAESINNTADSRIEAADVRDLELRSREESLKSREGALMRNADELDKVSADFKVFEARTSSNLRARELVVEEREAKLAAQMSEISDLRAKLNERLRALGTL